MLEKHGEIYVLRGRVLISGLSYEQCFGKSIKAYRESLNLTQSVFTECLGIKTSAVSKLESGDSIPNIMQVRTICKRLGIKERVLFDLADELYNASNNLN